jgi:hypothetical protein
MNDTLEEHLEGEFKPISRKKKLGWIAAGLAGLALVASPFTPPGRRASRIHYGHDILGTPSKYLASDSKGALEYNEQNRLRAIRQVAGLVNYQGTDKCAYFTTIDNYVVQLRLNGGVDERMIVIDIKPFGKYTEKMILEEGHDPMSSTPVDMDIDSILQGQCVNTSDLGLRGQADAANLTDPVSRSDSESLSILQPIILRANNDSVGHGIPYRSTDGHRISKRSRSDSSSVKLYPKNRRAVPGNKLIDVEVGPVLKKITNPNFPPQSILVVVENGVVKKYHFGYSRISSGNKSLQELYTRVISKSHELLTDKYGSLAETRD